MNLSGPFIKRPVMTILVMVAILLFGLFAYKVLPVSDLPNIDYPTITVSAEQPGGSPKYMADTVATPLERSFASISGLDSITSRSILGKTDIVLNFNLSAKIDEKEVEVQSAISRTLPDLPPMPNNPTYEKTNPANTPIMFICLTSSSQTLGKLYEYGYNIIAQPLSMIDGVSEVLVYGYPYAVRVQADPMKLAAYKMDLIELSRQLVGSNPNLPSGVLEGYSDKVTIESDGQILAAAKYNKVIVKESSGFPLRVENVGRAINALEKRYPYFHYITKNVDENVVVLAISRLPGSNTLDISKEILKSLPDLKRSLPGSVDLFIFYNYAETILASIKDVQYTLLIALLLVVIVIYLYLGKFFDTIIPSLVLPMAIIGTFIAMYLLGFSLDNLSLLALTLSIGFIVDDAIVVQENIVRYAEMGKTPFQAAYEGSKQISVTVFTMTLALSAVFIPMIWMPGILGRIFNEFSVTIVIAILCSGFISLTLNPMLCSLFLKHGRQGNGGWVFRTSTEINQKMLGLYERLLIHSINWKKTTIFIGILCFIFSLLILHVLPTSFIPPGNISLVEGLTQAAEGSSSERTIKLQKRAGEVIRNNPYIEGFISIAGYPTSDQGILYTKLVDPHLRPNSTTVAHSISQMMSQIPGMNVFAKPVPMINLEVGSSSSLGLYQYTLICADPATLYESARKMTEKMQKLPGFIGVNNDMRINSPQLNLTIDRDRAGIYGVTAEEIEKTLQYAFSSGRISTFSSETNLYDLILEVLPDYYISDKDLDLLYINSPVTGKLVPLTSLAKWDLVLAPSAINHIDIFPSVTISFGLSPEIALGTAIKELDHLADELLPDNVIGRVQGEAQVFIETFKTMTWLIIISIIVIYLLLGILYESFIHPFTILSALPVAVFGGLLTLYIFRETLSLYSMVGLIVLIGLVQKNGIMMIDFALEYLQKPDETPLKAILEACKTRFRPILMTTIAAMMGALPVAIGIGDNGTTNRPLGLVVFGGLFISQLVTLFVTPVVFLYMQSLETSISKRIKHKPPLQGASET